MAESHRSAAVALGESLAYWLRVFRTHALLPARTRTCSKVSALNSQSPNLKYKVKLFILSFWTDLVQVKLSRRVEKRRRGGEQRVWHTQHGAQVPQEGGNGGGTVPWQQAAGFREPRGARWSQAGLVGRTLSSPPCQKGRRCRPQTRRGSRRHRRGATGAGLRTRLSSKPSLRWHPTGLVQGLGHPQSLPAPAVMRWCLAYGTFSASAVSRCGNSGQPREQLGRKGRVRE